ncbi:UNVERIFIED_CONTAM: hypothetical protein K2H54_045145 [Gekko kuhli]
MLLENLEIAFRFSPADAEGVLWRAVFASMKGVFTSCSERLEHENFAAYLEALGLESAANGRAEVQSLRQRSRAERGLQVAGQ